MSASAEDLAAADVELREVLARCRDAVVLLAEIADSKAQGTVLSAIVDVASRLQRKDQGHPRADVVETRTYFALRNRRSGQLVRLRSSNDEYELSKGQDDPVFAAASAEAIARALAGNTCRFSSSKECPNWGAVKLTSSPPKRCALWMEIPGEVQLRDGSCQRRLYKPSLSR